MRRALPVVQQAWHILKKDVRYLRFDIAFTLLTMAAFALAASQSVRGAGPVSSIVPVIWWFLIARVVHAEALPGEKQFWLTKPYRRASLLLAKMFFALLFVSLPFLLVDGALVQAAGFSLGEQIPGLVWTQVLLLTSFVLPAAAIGSLTSGTAEFLLATLLLIFIVLARFLAGSSAPWGYYWMELEWVRTYALLLPLASVAIVILLWQYQRRQTFALRAMAASAAVMLLLVSGLLPWTLGFATQASLSQHRIDTSAMQIKLDSEHRWLGRIYNDDHDQIVAELPLQIEGIPAKTRLKPDGLSVTVGSAGNATAGVNEPPPSSFRIANGRISLRATLDQTFYARQKDQPLQLRGTLYFTLYRQGERTAIPLNHQPTPVSGIGLCSASRRFLFCRSPFRAPASRAVMQLRQEGQQGPKWVEEELPAPASYSPFPAELNIDPLFDFFSPRLIPITAAELESSTPLAHVQKDFAIDQVRLADYPADASVTSAARH